MDIATKSIEPVTIAKPSNGIDNVSTDMIDTVYSMLEDGQRIFEYPLYDPGTSVDNNLSTAIDSSTDTARSYAVLKKLMRSIPAAVLVTGPLDVPVIGDDFTNQDEKYNDAVLIGLDIKMVPFGFVNHESRGTICFCVLSYSIRT